MNHDEFETYVKSLNRDDYLNDEARAYLTQIPIVFDESDGMGDPRRGTNPSLVSRTFSSANEYYDDDRDRADVEDEHRVTIRNAIQQSSDIQRYQVYDGTNVIDHILVVEANYGMEGVAILQ